MLLEICLNDFKELYSFFQNDKSTKMTINTNRVMALFKNVIEFRNTKMLQNSIRIMPLFENVGNTKMTIKTEGIMPLKMLKITSEELYPLLKMLKKKIQK
jgi:hypothetical protein